MTLKNETGGATSGHNRSPRQYVTAGIASMVGTTIEWYDFFLYGTAAALIFNEIFFPAFDPLTGTLAAFATYSVGFFARPLGGIVFGHFGDRIGRKTMLLTTLIMMGIPTILIGFIPSYDSIGYWAAVLLVLMRFTQGLAVGGEWGGAILVAVEHAPEGKKGLFGSLPQMGVGAGLILSSMAMGAVAAMPEDAMLSWGWRVPFWASAALLVLGYFIRIKVAESPDFVAMQKSGKKEAMPLVTVLKKHPKNVLLVVGARLGEVTWFYTVVTFALAYATGTLGIAKSVMLDAIIWGAFFSLLTMPLCGWLGDRIGQKWVFMIGAVGVVVFGTYFFDVLATGNSLWITLAMIMAVSVVYGFLYGPEGSLFSSQFPPEVRYSGISLAVQVSGAIGGGLAPIMATWLLSLGDGDPHYVVWYLSTLGVIAFFSTWAMRSDQAEAGLRVRDATVPRTA